MMHRATIRGIAAVVVLGLAALGARPAAAAATVTSKGSTLTVAIDGGSDATIVLNLAGEVEVTAGGPTSTYPSHPNLVVDAAAARVLDIRFDATLPGSLTVQLGGTTEVHVGGFAIPTMAKNLTINGSDTGNQWVQLGSSGPLVVGGNATIDTGLGSDSLRTATFVLVLGSFKSSGIDHAQLENPLGITGNATISTKTERESGRWTVRDLMEVGGNLKVNGGPLSDGFTVQNGGTLTVEGNATFNFGDTESAVSPGQGVVLDNTTILGNVTVKSGRGYYSYFNTAGSTSFKKSVTVKLASNNTYGIIDGTYSSGKVSYTTGNGLDEINVYAHTDDAKLVINSKGGNDLLWFQGGPVFGRVTANLGAGDDDYVANGYVLPPGSQIKGVGLP